MPRSFTPRQAGQNAAFLEALIRTGNTRLAVRELGLNRSTYTKRRARHPAFAAEWEAALAAAHAAFTQNGGSRFLGAETPSRSSRAKSRGVCDETVPAPLDFARDERNWSTLRTKGGEPAIARTATGRLQLRRAPPGRMTPAAEQAFLAALADSANVRLAAAAVGFAHSSFLARSREDPAFAREMKVAISIASDRLVWAQIEPALRPHDDEGPRADLPIPKMTVEQAMMQLMFHRPNGPFQRGRRPHARLRTLEEVAPRIRAKISAIKRASHFERTGSWRLDGE